MFSQKSVCLQWEGVPTLDRGEEVPTLNLGRGYLPWIGEGYLPWMGERDASLEWG